MNHNDGLKALQGLTVTNLNGNSVELESLWKERRVALVFLRHFG